MTTPGWQPDRPSLIHGSLAYLRTLSAQELGTEPHLAEWSAVYGSVELEFDPTALNEALSAGDLATAILRQSQGMHEGAIKAISARAAAHGELELHLVKLLAKATGQPVSAILDELDAWAAQLHG